MKVKVVPVEPHRDQIEAAYPLLTGMPPRRAKDLCRLIYVAMTEHAPQARTGGLTANQRKVHEVITETIDETGEAPTLREIRDLLKFSDHSQAFRAVRALKRKKILDIGPGHRDIKILKRPEQT